jgi:hypothetical protein
VDDMTMREKRMTRCARYEWREEELSKKGG